MSTDITVRPVDPAGPAVSFDLVGDDDLQGQAGGWESLARPRRSAAAGWVGRGEVTYGVTVMLDGLASAGAARDRSVERECRLVESWALPTVKTGEPPILSIVGPVLVTPRSRWVLQSITWAERIRSATTGQRVQQVLSLSFTEYVEPTLVKSPAARARNRKPKKPKKGKDK